MFLRVHALRGESVNQVFTDADVVTGEGRLDGQSYTGKAPVGIAKIAKKYGKTVIAFAGCVTDDAVVCNQYGIDAFFDFKSSLHIAGVDKQRKCIQNFKDTDLQVFNLIKTK